MVRWRYTATSHRRLLIVGLILLVSLIPLNTAGGLYAQEYSPPPPPSPSDSGGGGGDGGGGNAGSGNGGGNRLPGPGAFPGRGTNAVAAGESIERALTRAEVTTGFDTQELVEHERARFTATIHYARPLVNRPTINVAYANDAWLTQDVKQFDIEATSDKRRNLDEGVPDGQGGLAISWSWNVTPRAVGELTFNLQIQPVLYWNGQETQELEHRNQPIPINVVINPNHAKFDAVVARSETDFILTAPDHMEAEEPSTITASFVRQGASPDVGLRLVLDPVAGSVPVTIVSKPLGPYPPSETVFAEWEVTPGKDGDVRLNAAVIITTKAGDRPLQQRVDRQIAKVAVAAPSFWGSIQGIITGLASLVALVAAVAGLAKIFPRQWKWMRRKLHLRDDPSPPAP